MKIYINRWRLSRIVSLGLRGLALPLVLSLLLSSAAAGQAATPPVKVEAPPGLWTDINEIDLREYGERWIVPERYRLVSADETTLRELMDSAPVEFTPEAGQARVTLPLPLPDGTEEWFQIEESSILAPELAAHYPDLRTFWGRSIANPATTVRFDHTPFGFHAIIFSSTGTVYIDPYRRGDTQHYVSYFKADYRNPDPEPWACGFAEANPDAVANVEAFEFDSHSVTPFVASGSVLRTYRLALAATGEYTVFHGGTVPDGLAAIVTSMNRINGIYEREVAIRMVLVPNNNLVVYTNGATDPYTNNNGSTMLGQNQANLDAVIGTANYDIGHVFSTGGGGVATLNGPCNASSKARGVTGSSSPVGDPFDVDYVAHEMGHQFGALHTFNGTTGSCGGGNRSASAAYEPGSGTTIMAYAGICGAEDIQPHSDDDFHSKSFDQIVAFSTGAGNSCAITTTTGNTAPTVNAGLTYTIPVQTPFALTGSATDPEGDPLTFDWEQYDLGTASPPNTDNGNRPIFRSFLATPSSTRLFPQLSDILNNVSTLGESLPTTTRILTFRLTARDNRPGGGGVNYSSVVINVTSSAGPFSVTAPSTAVSWNGGSQQTVAWNVGNTTAAPVSCSTVDLTLSTDGGNTFPYTLAAATANDGSETITVPNLSTTTARIMARCSTNIFFDISNPNFTIVGGSNTAPTLTAPVDQIIAEDTTTGALPFTVGDPETPAANLVVTATTSNVSLLPLSNILLGGSGVSRTVALAPSANLFGSAVITLSVSDGLSTTLGAFTLTVTSVNDAPTISAIADQQSSINTPTSVISFTVNDLESPAGTLTVTVASSNLALVPEANVVFGGGGADRNLVVTPAAEQWGYADLTITVDDGDDIATETFRLTVLPRALFLPLVRR